MPSAFAVALGAMAILPAVRENVRVLATFLVSAAALWVWNASLLLAARRSGRVLTMEVVLRKQHYLQASAQFAVFVYWGMYWPPVFSFAPFIVAQLIRLDLVEVQVAVNVGCHAVEIIGVLHIFSRRWQFAEDCGNS